MGSSVFKRAALCLALLAGGATTTRAQGAREVAGRVVRGGRDSTDVVSGALVVLHRVGTDRASPLDSMRTDAAGRYRFRYRPSGDSAALYFVSSSHHGIAYFTPPFRSDRVTGDDAELTVFDTTSAPVPIHVRGRHVIVRAPGADGSREVIEVYELSNDSSVTRTARRAPTFEARAPVGARDIRGGGGDVAADAVLIDGERVRLLAALAPGVKQFAFRYLLPSGVRKATLPVADTTTVLELLIEEKDGKASGATLKETASATLDGRTFHRYLAQDVVAGTTIAVALAGGLTVSLPVALVLLGLGVGILVLVSSRASRWRTAGAARGTEHPDAIAQRIAALDAAFERLASPAADQRADHYEQRARLKAQLTAALARRDGLA